MKKILLGLLLLILVGAAVFFAPAFLTPVLTAESRVMINKPQEEVWKKFTDETNMDKWLQGFKSIERLSGESGTVGSKYKIVLEEEGNHFEAIETVKEVVENKKFAFELDGDVATADIVVTMENKGLTTVVTQSDTMKAKGIFLKAMFYWMQSSMRERSQSNLNNLKKFIEES